MAQYEPILDPQQMGAAPAPPLPPPPPPPPPPPAPSKPATQMEEETFASTRESETRPVNRKKGKKGAKPSKSKINVKEEGDEDEDDAIAALIVRRALEVRFCYAFWLSVLVVCLISFLIAIILLFAL
ncbi:unnamed protein product [Bursaphelenchus okinawaensis]|uniref:Uncharacterized protein n=1 Tax=Bursaphelenchus okinawaensis TaxID=465554 RepID=A0A811LHV8_9BILA|nr:unnamed protein product [Bursaphelenchus okinawaensis]CAG9123531.1 unnamed protein product [Bursaphelenchus okinawaensis]